MAQTQMAFIATWLDWDGRIVNGRFPLRQYLGGSEDSAVYLTEVEGARAAIKLVPTDSPHVRAQLDSWKLARQLSHPNLVRIFDTGVWHADAEQDMQFAVMEYCEESLAGVLRQRPLTPGEAREMLLPALAALQYLHAKGIVHGQINPANVLASGDQLKLSTDKVRRSGEPYTPAAVTPYDAPEKTAGTTSLSADIWSLGVTLFEALTKHIPPRGKDGVLGLSEKVPPPFDAIIKGCLTPERDRRLSISAIRELLERPKLQVVTPKTPSVETAPIAATIASSLTPAVAAQDFSPPGAKAGRAMFAVTPRWIVAAFGLFVIIAVALGLYLTHRSPQTSPSTSTAAAQSNGVIATPALTNSSTQKPVALIAGPGTVLRQVMPEIPGKAKNSINGTVKVSVRVEVNANGKVSRATLATRGPSTYFANRALEAARQWTFVAPVRDGKAQASNWMIRFEFRRSGARAAAQRSSGG